ncbi:hypothetical protein GG344DRAFT_83312 [Lentinula edodes]|nr:hypothetical protein GG344DRAFT_83312 [Lentinula edodes]
MSASRTTTTTVASTASSSRSRPLPPPPPPPSDSATHKEEDLEDEDEDDIIRKAQARVEKRRKRERRRSGPDRLDNKRRRLMAAAATARSQRGTSPSEVSVSPWRPVVEIRRTKNKGKGKARAEPVGGDADDGDDGDDDDKEPCEQCRVKKISCQMQAGKRSSLICKPCHDAKIRCSYSGRPCTVKRERGSNPTGEHLAVLESQMAQLLADNRQLRDDNIKANSYHRHFNRKLDWLIMDAARRRKSPPELPEAGPSGVSKKRRRVVDSDEEEEREIEGEMEKDREEVKEGEEGALAPKRAKAAPSEKGKEKEVVE